MKNILFVLVLFNLRLLAAVNSSLNSISDQAELVGGVRQNYRFKSSISKLSGLGNTEKIFYKFERPGDYFINQNREIVDSIKITSLKILSITANVDEDKRELTNFNGNLDYSVEATIGIKSDGRLSGKYTTPNIILELYSKKGNGEESLIRIPIQYELNFLKELSLKTSPMNLGIGIQGQKMSSFDGTPGYLEIEGEPNKIFRVSYPSKVEIVNKKDASILIVFITTPKLEKTNTEDYLGSISSSGLNKIEFNGEVKETRSATIGEYNGKFTIKVRYD
ncbi:MAG: DUF4402 domain-containing protein [Cetobacterium sp.]